jgi:hypothetical protein
VSNYIIEKEVAMSVNWGPHFIVPSETLKTFSGRVLLRETFDEELLKKELATLGLPGDPMRATNPWYCRKRGTETWVKIGESSDRRGDFPVAWDTTNLENGEYEVLGLMHVWAGKGDHEVAVARQNIVNVVIEN